MFMLHLGEIPEEWTHKRSVADLASAMSLRVDSVWRQVNGAEVLTKTTDVKPGDRIVIRRRPGVDLTLQSRRTEDILIPYFFRDFLRLFQRRTP